MSDASQALGWTLIHFCWQATAIAACYWVVNLWFKKAHSQTRYLLTLATLFLMLIAAVATFGYETVRCSGNTYFQVSNSPTPPLATPSIGIVVADVGFLTKQAALIQLGPFLPWIDGAWLFGVLCFSVRSVGGWWWLQRLRQRTMEETSATIQATFSKVCSKLKIARLIDLRISERISIPMTLGFLRPLVLLPASVMLALSPDQLEVILAHELAHVRRADYFWNLLQTLAETLFFFHPAVWWVGNRLKEQRELCCDDIALAMCADPLLYATALLRVEEQRSAGLSLAMALDGHQSRSDFRTRILRILGEPFPQPASAGLRSLSLITICAGFFLLLSLLPKAVGSLSLLHSHEEHTLSAEGAPVAKLVALQIPKPATTPGETAEGKRWEPEAALRQPTAKLAVGQLSPNDPSDKSTDYINQIRAAGYNVDPGQYDAMQKSGITPEYAREMANVGFGKPSVGNLIAMKGQMITSASVAALRAAGVEPRNIDELVSYAMFDVNPEFVAGMKAAGFDEIPPHKLQDLRASDVTPDYAKTIRQEFPNATPEQLIQLRVLHIDENFIASANSHGFTPLTIRNLLELRASGLLTNYLPSGTDPSEKHRASD